MESYNASCDISLNIICPTLSVQDSYVTSTKKQKMGISRSIVDKVRTELCPPGRFLEKNAETGLWHEVEDRRALEKTAQALRDGAAPLRKQLTDDMMDPNFLVSMYQGATAVASSGNMNVSVGDYSSTRNILMYIISHACFVILGIIHHIHPSSFSKTGQILHQCQETSTNANSSSN